VQTRSGEFRNACKVVLQVLKENSKTIRGGMKTF
jgi:hypothetical protein